MNIREGIRENLIMEPFNREDRGRFILILTADEDGFLASRELYTSEETQGLLDVLERTRSHPKK